jgi:SOS-response transcriptional repressor LexA
MTSTPDHYAILPAKVRYCKDLSAQEKLLYAEIAATPNDNGYCWATNNYFAELYGLSKKTISRQINNLAEPGFVRIEMVRAENSNQILERRIYLTD